MRAGWHDKQDLALEHRAFFAGNTRSILRALSVLSAATAILGMLLAIRRAPSIIENDHRLAPTFAVAAGYRLYYGVNEGPDLSTLYGPVTALAYAPALWASTPITAVRFATLLSLAFFLSPMFLIASSSGKLPAWLVCASLLGLAAALIFLSDSLEMSSVEVHADAPALGAGGIACWLCTRKNLLPNDLRYAVLSGVFAAVSVMSKQNMLPLLVVLAVWWGCSSSFTRMIQFAGAGVAVMIFICCGTLLVSSSPQAAWFNWFYMPTHQPYDKAMFFPMLNSLVRTCLLYLLPVVVLSVGSLSSKWRECLSSPAILLVLVGLSLVPTSLLGRLKAGASQNALSPAIYFFALACMLVLSTYLFQILDNDLRVNKLTSLAIVTSLLVIFVLTKLPQNVYLSAREMLHSPIGTVYSFCRTHPGQVYFPQFPLTVLMAEGHLYHFSWGLSDRRVAGYPVSQAQFLEHIPPTARRMALIPWVRSWEDDIYSRCQKRESTTRDAALPGFEICVVR